MPARISGVAWVALGLVASAAWFVVAVRLMRRWGLREAAPAIGLMVATVVALTLWRWAVTDRQHAALAALRCPRCHEALQTRHEHARPGGVSAGVQRWACEHCGYQYAEALTCAECAA